jgi:pantoate--beta-alanine ligase
VVEAARPADPAALDGRVAGSSGPDGTSDAAGTAGLAGADGPRRQMIVVRTRAELRAALATAARPIGLVPTMGWLHAGHRSLMERSRADDATTVVSIFVNPRQFGSPEDLARYPRNEPRDLATCEAESVDIVFAPPVEEVYPPGFDAVVGVGAISRPLEGIARPGHFEGVATVVAILFGLVGADRAYFGQKDAQQVMVIRQMARDLAMPTEVVACPTVREPDGLALSSRNARLTPEQRAAAPVLRRALLAGRALREAARATGGAADGASEGTAGGVSGDAIRAEMRRVLATDPVAIADYVSCADARTLVELDRVDGPALLSVAALFGTVRLIDNEPLE